MSATEVPRGLGRARADLRGGMGIFLCAGAVATVLLAAVLLFLLIFSKGAAAFWPSRLTAWELTDGRLYLVGVQDRRSDGSIQAHVANREQYGMLDFLSVREGEIARSWEPADAVFVDRFEYGPFHGFVEGTVVKESTPEQEELLTEGEYGLDDFLGRVAHLREEVESARGRLARAANAADQARIDEASTELQGAQAELSRYALRMRTPDDRPVEIPGSNVLGLRFPNRAGLVGRVGTWIGSVWSFVTDDPRESGTAGGVWPALVGTSLLVILMSIMVVPFGVLAAVYLNEYARESWYVRLVRISVNNLAGVPSIVYGVFGLGFLVYGLGGAMDQAFFSDKLPAPTLGAGCVLWASVTMALLTVPVVVVATEEGLRSVPRDQRDGALALGATRYEMLRKVILPGAKPGILTGTILAVSRAAGEVAPLMLTGVVGFARELPIDFTDAPFLHLDRRFMHLGFHIYGVGFQSPNVEATEPLVYATATLLLSLVLLLNYAAIRMRTKVRRSLQGR